MNYHETLEFLFNQLPAYHRIGKAAYKNSLENTLKLDAYFNHPHLKYKTIHIAGTNGKGSVSHLTASILQEAGYKTGLYTSPHLTDFRERIRVDGQMIPEDEVVRFAEANNEILNLVKPSFFEMTVAMAFDYFARAKVEVAVIEVGLGGRLDSTNIITPEVSVITNIGHDHMDLLGNTIGKVAAEKAGIIKEKTPVVIGETHPMTQEIFISRSNEMNAPVMFADRNFECFLDRNYNLNEGRKFEIKSLKDGKLFNGVTFLTGDYQQKNITTVFALLSILKEKFSFSDKNTYEGIKNVVENTGLAGRWHVIGSDPLIICDTGHNKEGLEYVVSQLKRIPAECLHIVLGFVTDKDISAILPLFPVEAVYYFTKASVLRAMDENILREEAIMHGLRGGSYPDVKTALMEARSQASPEDVIFIGGSTFVVADALGSL